MKVSKLNKLATTKLVHVFAALKALYVVNVDNHCTVAFAVDVANNKGQVLFLDNNNFVNGTLEVEYLAADVEHKEWNVLDLKIQGRRIAVKLSGSKLITDDLRRVKTELQVEKKVEQYIAEASGAAKVTRHVWSSNKSKDCRTLKTWFTNSVGERMSLTTTPHLDEVAELISKRCIMLPNDVWAQLLAETNYPLASWNKRTWLGNRKHRTIGRVAKELGMDTDAAFLSSEEWEQLLSEGIYVKDTCAFIKELFRLHEAGINGGFEGALDYWLDTLSANSAMDNSLFLYPVFTVFNRRSNERTPWSTPTLYLRHVGLSPVEQEHDI